MFHIAQKLSHQGSYGAIKNKLSSSSWYSECLRSVFSILVQLTQHHSDLLKLEQSILCDLIVSHRLLELIYLSQTEFSDFCHSLWNTNKINDYYECQHTSLLTKIMWMFFFHNCRIPMNGYTKNTRAKSKPEMLNLWNWWREALMIIRLHKICRINVQPYLVSQVKFCIL